MKSLAERFCVGILWLNWSFLALAVPAVSATVTETPPAVGPLKVQSPDGMIEATIHVDGKQSKIVTGRQINITNHFQRRLFVDEQWPTKAKLISPCKRLMAQEPRG